MKGALCMLVLTAAVVAVRASRGALLGSYDAWEGSGEPSERVTNPGMGTIEGPDDRNNQTST